MKIENNVIYGNFSKLIPVTVSDAEFIVSLRNGNHNMEFISKGAETIQQQYDWIDSYLRRSISGSEHYFIACDLEGKKWGTFRLYNISNHQCTGGSWLMLQRTPACVSLESQLLAMEFAFTKLRIDIINIDVRRNNTRVWKYHELCGALLVGEDNMNRYYKYTNSSLIIAKNIVYRAI